MKKTLIFPLYMQHFLLAYAKWCPFIPTHVCSLGEWNGSHALAEKPKINRQKKVRTLKCPKDFVMQLNTGACIKLCMSVWMKPSLPYCKLPIKYFLGRIAVLRT